MYALVLDFKVCYLSRKLCLHDGTVRIDLDHKSIPLSSILFPLNIMQCIIHYVLCYIWEEEGVGCSSFIKELDDSCMLVMAQRTSCLENLSLIVPVSDALISDFFIDFS